MRKFPVFGIILCLSLIVTACLDQVTATASSNPVVDTAVSATATALSPTETVMISAIELCPVESSTPSPPELDGIETAPNRILDYLNQGGSLESLRRVIEESQTAPMEGMTLSQQDYSGDGYDDLAVSVVDSNQPAVTPAGVLLFFVCSQGQYQLAYTSPPSVEYGVPVIQSDLDLTGDSVPDLLTTRQMCGAHTCFFELSVLSWNGNTLENRFPEPTNDLPTPTISLDGPQADGSYHIVVTANGIGSVGAGPFRQYSRVWVYDSQVQQFHQTETILHPSTFRIHVLHDADQAVLDGDLEAALGLYNQVINDSSLDDWMSGEEGARTLAAYARYRLSLTLLQIGQPDQAQAEFSRLLSTVRPDAPGYAFVGLAQAFWDSYQASGDLAAACQIARQYAQTHSETILDTLYYGYANKTYVAADICPVEN